MATVLARAAPTRGRLNARLRYQACERLPTSLVPRQLQQQRHLQQRRTSVVSHADPSGSSDKQHPLEKAAVGVLGEQGASTLVTGLFIALWYFLNVGFNLTNKSLFNVFPFPWFVSTIHVVVGALYCIITYVVGLKAASFQRPITVPEFWKIFGPASMHAIGHVAANLSFAAVAISLTHTVKTLEPAFNVVLSKLILGVNTTPAALVSLLPIMVGVSLASAAELSFNWLGFLSAMASNLTFGFRAVWSKKAMTDIKDLGSTGIYAYTTLISVFICAPGVFIFEGSQLAAGMDKAIAVLGAQAFYTKLIAVGLLYHLYNQFAFNTLSRVSPVSHGVCNVVKRICIIGSSVLFFGNKLSPQTQIGTVVALLGTFLYSEAVKNAKLKASGGSK